MRGLRPNVFSRLRRVYLIAEIGVNHNGDMALARALILAAKQSGADAVKFQTFTADALASTETPKVAYQRETTAGDETHHQMLRRLELGRPEHRELLAFCAAAGIDFLSTPYDVDSARFLTGLGVKMFKTASADIVDLPLQRYVASTGKPAIVATGMSTLAEVEQVVDIYREAGNRDLVLLHCVSNYPCSDASLNLRAMQTLARAFGAPVGFSDHSIGAEAAVIAVALGAKVIEKHFTLDKNLPGPDHRASATPDEFADLHRQVRRAEEMLGDRHKTPQAEERQMAAVSRKSVALARAVRAGETLLAEDLALLRPGTGLPASALGQIIGARVRTNLQARHHLRWDDLEAP